MSDGLLIFYDTETTGFVHGSKPISDEKQPHIVQLAAQLVTPENETVQEFSLIVDPGIAQGVHIPSKLANEVHGIDDAKAEKFGVNANTAIDFFMHLHSFAETRVAHNDDFDKEIIKIARYRRAGQDPGDLGSTPYCTMKVCKRVVPGGKSNLQTSYQHFFGESFGGAHDAMNDVRACRRIYFHLKGLGH